MSEKHGKIKHSKPVAWQSELVLWPETERVWAETAAAAMIFADAQETKIAEQLATVRQSMEASAQSAEKLFGNPIDYGRTEGKRLRVASDIIESRLTVRDASGVIAGGLLGLGMLLIVLGIWIGFDDGWTHTSFDGPIIFLFPALSIFVGLGFWGWTLRTKGHLVAAALIWLGVLAGFMGAIVMAAVLDDQDLPAPPNWVMPLIGLALVVAALNIPQQKPRTLLDDSTWDDERWFDQAQRLLRGRYFFTRAQAEHVLREAREHRTFSGRDTSIAQEFGNVELFVAQLAPGVKKPITRGIVLRRAGFSIIVMFFGISLVGEFMDEPIGAWLIIRGLMYLCLVALVIWSWRPKQIAEETQEQDQRRTKDAESLAQYDEGLQD